MAWLYLDPETSRFIPATEDGLFAASTVGGFAKDWAVNQGLQKTLGVGSPYETQTGTINYYAGFIASWYAYSAGRLDALTQEMEGETMTHFGHDHAMAVAKAFLAGMNPLLDAGTAPLGRGV